MLNVLEWCYESIIFYWVIVSLTIFLTFEFIARYVRRRRKKKYEALQTQNYLNKLKSESNDVIGKNR